MSTKLTAFNLLTSNAADYLIFLAGAYYLVIGDHFKHFTNFWSLFNPFYYIGKVLAVTGCKKEDKDKNLFGCVYGANKVTQKREYISVSTIKSMQQDITRLPLINSRALRNP